MTKALVICLIHQAGYLLDRQLKQLEQAFLKEGGLRERMTRARPRSEKKGGAVILRMENREESGSRPWREVLNELRPDDSIPSAILRGSRVKEELTQVQLSEMTGIPRRHISEMEHGKRTMGKETAKKLAKALNCDYRVFL